MLRMRRFSVLLMEVGSDVPIQLVTRAPLEGRTYVHPMVEANAVHLLIQKLERLVVRVHKQAQNSVLNMEVGENARHLDVKRWLVEGRHIVQVMEEVCVVGKRVVTELRLAESNYVEPISKRNNVLLQMSIFQ